MTSDSASFDLVLEVDSGTDAMCSEQRTLEHFELLGTAIDYTPTHTCNYATNEATQSGTRNAVHCPADEICVDF